MATYWNPSVTPQVRAAALFAPDSAAAATLRGQGLTAAVVAPARGVIKGTSAVVELGWGEAGRLMVEPDAALHVSITVPPGPGRGEYPSSPMGAYTLVRQAFYDADWYAQAQAACRRNPRLPRPEPNEALAALQGYAAGGKHVVVDARDELYVLRADRLGKELGLDVVVRGSGREYRRLDLVKAARRPILVPVNFPKAPVVDSPEATVSVELDDLLHWDFAPENPGRLAKAGVTIALTTDGLRDRSQFLSMVRTAVERGLPADSALAALTVTPARLFGVSARLGTLEPGKLASIVVTDGDLFARKTRVLETWVEGERYEVVKEPTVDPRGTWKLQQPPQVLVLRGELDKISGTIAGAGACKLSSAQLSSAQLLVTFPGDSLGFGKGIARMTATVSDSSMLGSVEDVDGVARPFAARRTGPYAAPPDTVKPAPVEMASFPITYPFGAFGRTELPKQPDAVAFTHATVWTCGPRGKIADGTVLVRRGRIAAVGENVEVPAGALIVDAAGKHLTPGIMDSHSHTATDGGINEAGQAITAEVRIGDFVDCNDINIYRQLAGGVTEAHVLHGSANPIGGQCQPLKYRWGLGPEEMKFAEAPATLKFALGENVKESNDEPGGRPPRYPQTRMGVEQMLRDEFRAAREYRRAWAAWRATHEGLPPRRDLELDAMAEVLDGTRLVYCHAYRQDEILMLMKVFDDYGVKPAALEHDLEGYKLADEMARRGIGGSTFSDWWAYKMEVVDAIPYNGALMHEAGVAVTYNSDSNELARHLNTEAAKATKYGGVPEEEALEFVTLNPARHLRVDKRVGSIEVGKDADLALWSGPPMASATRCEQTWVDGRRYFDRDEDAEMRRDVEKMRAVLVQKALRQADKESGKSPPERAPRVPRSDLYDLHADEGGEER